MISGKPDIAPMLFRCRARRGTKAGIAALLCLLTADLCAAAAPDLAAFVAQLARPVPASTTYTEVRFVHLLRKPVVLHGELEYAGPGKLGKRVDAPYRETTTIADASVSVVREGRAPKQFALDRAPELAALLSGFSALLGGDAATLQEFYTIDLVQNGAHWTLTLTPRTPAFSKHLRALVVDGREHEPVCFTLQQADGDGSVMLLGALATTVLPDAPSPATLATLCQSAP
jgi:hypothetical protein